MEIPLFVDGFQYSLYEIDEALREKIPALQRRDCTPRIFDELGINELLDMRNELMKLIDGLVEVEMVDV